MIAADRGLCGAYNSSVIRAGGARDPGAAGARAATTRSSSSGSKAEGYFRFRDYRIDAAFTGFSDSPTYEDAREIARRGQRAVRGRRRRPVEIVYTAFVSAGTQVVVRAR